MPFHRPTAKELKYTREKALSRKAKELQDQLSRLGRAPALRGGGSTLRGRKTPGALLRLDRFRRDDKYDRVRLRNQAAEARFPVLASSDVVAVEERRKAYEFEPGHQFVGERGRILPRIGDEDAAWIGRAVTTISLRVCPKTSGGITKFSEHKAD